MSPAAFDELVVIGRVVKPQGRRGEVAVQPFSDRPDRFPGLRTVYVSGPGGSAQPVTVTSCWPHKGRFVLKIQGVDSIDEAEAYRGRELRIPEQDLARLPAGSYYHHQLRGLAAEDEAGRPLGRVAELVETGGEAVVLVVRGSGREMLVPLAESFVRAVDIPAGRLVLRPPQMVD